MARLHKWANWLAFPVGAALSLAFAPFNIWPLAVICPALLMLAWTDATPRRAALLGFLFSSGTFLAGTYWLYHSVYVIGQAPLPVALLLMLGLVAIMGAYAALLGYCQARWLPTNGLVRYVLALPAAWVFVEWLRGWLFSGFPWLSLGYAGIDTWLAAYAPIGGVYTLSVLFAAAAGALAFAAQALIARNDNEQNAFDAIRPMFRIGILAVALPWLIGWPLRSHEWTTPSNGPVSVAVVQGAVPQEMKWSQEQHDATLKLYRDLTVPHWGTQIIVWPESSLPNWAESLTEYLTNLWQEANRHGSQIVMGIQHYDSKTDAAFNSVLALSDHAEWYNKRHLVPFGEYFPVPAWVRNWMRMMSLPHSDFASGADKQPPLTVAGQSIGVTICYEDAYGSAQLSVLDQATLLVNVTNDAWFGDSTARHQHLQISRMRALEAGRPLLRAANDGISAIIDAQGMLVAQLPSFKPDVLSGTVQPRVGLTPYARVGNWPVIIYCLAALLMCGFYRLRLDQRPYLASPNQVIK